MKQKNQERFNRSPSGEPINPGPSLSQFVEIVAGMGGRAAIHGTVIRRLRQDKDKQDKSTDE